MRILSLHEFYENRDSLFDGAMVSLTCDAELDSEQVRSDLARFEQPIVYFDGLKRVRAMAFPAVFMPDFYFGKIQNELVVSTNLLLLAKRFEGVAYDEVELSNLVIKSYCTPSRTPLREISRFEGYTLYRLDTDGNIAGTRLSFEPLGWADEEACYEDFKSRIDASVDFYLEKYAGRKMHVLLSGGVDSRLVFLSLVKREVEFDSQSLVYVPLSIDDNLKDVALAQEVSRLAGVSHHIVAVAPDGIDESYLAPVVEEMPCCAHMTIGFKVPLDEFCAPGDVVWTGQNMDTFYNMGATMRFSLDRHAVAQLFKRWYLSEPFAKTLPDVKGAPSLFSRLLNVLGLQIFRSGYHDPDMSLPANAADYLARFAASDDYVVLRPGSSTPDSLEEQITPHELKELLFQDKLGFARGGDAQSIAASARLNGGEVAFPYATTELIQWFNSYRLGMKDVFSPKRFVYRYVKEIADSIDPRLGNFEAPEPDEFLKGIKGVDLYTYAREMLNSRLMRSMHDVAYGGSSPEHNLEGRGAWTVQGEIVRRYWEASLHRSLFAEGVRVRHETDASK